MTHEQLTLSAVWHPPQFATSSSGPGWPDQLCSLRLCQRALEAVMRLDHIEAACFVGMAKSPPSGSRALEQFCEPAGRTPKTQLSEQFSLSDEAQGFSLSACPSHLLPSPLSGIPAACKNPCCRSPIALPKSAWPPAHSRMTARHKRGPWLCSGSCLLWI